MGLEEVLINDLEEECYREIVCCSSLRRQCPTQAGFEVGLLPDKDVFT